MRLIVLDMQGRLVGLIDGRGRRRGGCLLGKVLFDQLFFVVLVDDCLSVANEERGHVEDERGGRVDEV